MPLDVLEEVVGPDEGPTAGGAHELLLPGVSSLVTGQFVTPSEDLVTVREWTAEWFLS